MDVLSRRERDVLRLIAQGIKHEVIAKRLNISLQRVHNLCGSIFRKFGVNNSHGAVAAAFIWKVFTKEDEATIRAAFLNPRDIQILRMVGQNRTNTVIARRVGYSIDTLIQRLPRLYKKIGVNTREEAAAFAQQQGYLAEAA